MDGDNIHVVMYRLLSKDQELRSVEVKHAEQLTAVSERCNDELKQCRSQHHLTVTKV